MEKVVTPDSLQFGDQDSVRRSVRTFATRLIPLRRASRLVLTLGFSAFTVTQAAEHTLLFAQVRYQADQCPGPPGEIIVRVARASDWPKSVEWSPGRSLFEAFAACDVTDIRFTTEFDPAKEARLMEDLRAIGESRNCLTSHECGMFAEGACSEATGSGVGDLGFRSNDAERSCGATCADGTQMRITCREITSRKSVKTSSSKK